MPRGHLHMKHRFDPVGFDLARDTKTDALCRMDVRDKVNHEVPTCLSLLRSKPYLRSSNVIR
jgi:hypothetical protein